MMLVEASATEFERTQVPSTMTSHKKTAKAGGSIAKHARFDIEKRTGRKVVSSQNATDLIGKGKTPDAIFGKAKKIPE